MRNLTKLFLTGALMLPTLSQAQREAHGGDAVVCLVKKGDTIKVGNEKYRKWKTLKVEDTDYYRPQGLDSIGGKIIFSRTMPLFSNRETNGVATGDRYNNGISGFIYDGIIPFQGTLLQVDLVKSAVTLEYYKLKNMKNRKSSFLEDNEDKSFKEVLNKLHGLFVDVPEFKEKLKNAQNRYTGIGLITEDVIKSETGITDIDDGGHQLILPNNCAQVQVAVREVDQLYISSMFNQLGKHDNTGWVTAPKWKINGQGLQHALLQFHEELYYIGSTEFGHKSSAQTQSLIIRLLSEKSVSTENKTKLLKKYNFLN